MVAEEDRKQGEYVCLHCTGKSFILIGLQRHNGLFKDHELWRCKSCHSTFARETIEVKKTAEDETFNKRALSYYCRIKFAS
jgi:transposase-like protein